MNKIDLNMNLVTPKNTQPIFFIGSGRCGTRSMFKMLSDQPNIEIHHEYLITHIQPASQLYYMGLMSHREVTEQIKKIHGSAIHYSESEFWIDSSTTLSWLIKPLADIFPNAKFILLIRDGRKVVSSFFHKLSYLVYNERGLSILDAWLKNPELEPMPPPELRYWLNIPQKGQPFYDEFPAFDQFSRICYHWFQVNNHVLNEFKSIREQQYTVFKLEDITSDARKLIQMFNFMGIPYKADYFNFLQKPQNVLFPKDFELTEEQRATYFKIAGDLHEKLGYSYKNEYRVQY